MYTVIVSPKAKKSLRKLPKKYQRAIDKVFCEVLPRKPFTGKKMHGDMKNVYSYRVWPYRILYRIEKKKITVNVIAIGHRQGIYQMP